MVKMVKIVKWAKLSNCQMGRIVKIVKIVIIVKMVIMVKIVKIGNQTFRCDSGITCRYKIEDSHDCRRICRKYASKYIV